MEATTAKCSLESHLVFGGQQMTVVQGAHQIFPHIGAQPIKYFPMPLIYRKCTSETPCSHGEGECEVDSDCDSSTIPHVCESNCLDRWARQICTKTKTTKTKTKAKTTKTMKTETAPPSLMSVSQTAWIGEHWARKLGSNCAFQALVSPRRVP